MLCRLGQAAPGWLYPELWNNNGKTLLAGNGGSVQCPALSLLSGSCRDPRGPECHQPGDVPCSEEVQGLSVALPPARCALLCPHTLSWTSSPSPPQQCCWSCPGSRASIPEPSLAPPSPQSSSKLTPAPGFPGNVGWEHLRLPVPAAVPGHGSPLHRRI